MLFLNHKDIEELIDMKEIISVVEKSFIEFARQTVSCPKRLYIDVKKHKGTVFIMPCYLSEMEAFAT